MPLTPLNRIYFDDLVYRLNTTLRKNCPYSEISDLCFSVLSPNLGKCGTEKFRIWKLFTQCQSVTI